MHFRPDTQTSPSTISSSQLRHHPTRVMDFLCQLLPRIIIQLSDNHILLQEDHAAIPLGA
jgi:hypothetical protein